MSASVHLALVIHNHQPIGNFSHVVERAYEDSYRPFLEIFRRYPKLAISLHTSGSLLDWLAQQHPEYLDDVAQLASAGRIQVLGGAYYEPILPMIPRRDRRGQIERMNRAIESRFGQAPLGMWLPERVWEPSLASDMGAAGIEHVVLDDFHFINAGLSASQLDGYFLTEDEGHLVAVFPGSERLRYLIPFAPPEETIAYLRDVATSSPGAVVVFGDDGEKFGAWPGMREHVFERGWLVRFFDLLSENSEWLDVTTLEEVVQRVSPRGRVYIPPCSYREMTEWADLEPARSPGSSGAASENSTAMQRAPRSPSLWRNFLVKYPEAAAMHARMVGVSDRLAATIAAGGDGDLVAAAETELYKSQCNCGYWHGTFGGVYLPHLRQAVYRHLIEAESLLDREERRSSTWVEASVADVNLDVHREVVLSNDKLSLVFLPHLGGRLGEFGLRRPACNLLATLSPREEPYREAPSPTKSNEAKPSIGPSTPMGSLIDHFYDERPSLEQIISQRAIDRGDFATERYTARVRRGPETVAVTLSRRGNSNGASTTVVKQITLAAGSETIEIDYALEGLPPRATRHFAVEFHFAALATAGSERYFHDGRRNALGGLGSPQEFANRRALHLRDEFLGLDVGLKFSRAGHIHAYCAETESRNEVGLERITQSVAVVVHWHVQADAEGRWTVSIKLPLDGSMAEERWARGDVRHLDLGDTRSAAPRPARALRKRAA